MPRLLYVNGQRVSDRREELKLSQEDLAAKADVSIGTVKRAEGGHRCFLSRIRDIAKALELPDYKVLLAASIIQNGLIVLTIKFRPPPDRLSQYTAQLLRQTLESELALQNDIEEINVRKGSVLFSLLCHHDDVSSFVEALAFGFLEYLYFTSIDFRRRDIEYSCDIRQYSPTEYHIYDHLFMNHPIRLNSETHELHVPPGSDLFRSRRSWFFSVLHDIQTYNQTLAYGPFSQSALYLAITDTTISVNCDKSFRLKPSRPTAPPI